MTDRNDTRPVSHEDFRRLEEHVRRLEARINMSNETLQEIDNIRKAGKAGWLFVKVATGLGVAWLTYKKILAGK